MKRYLVSMENRGFEFQTKYFINTKEFWEELEHDGYFQIGERTYIPLKKQNITSIQYIGDI